MNNGTANKCVRERVLQTLWDYVDENFHKLSEDKKIKIILALCTKNVPQVVEGTYTSTTKMEVVKIDSNNLEINFGNNRITSDTQHPN